MRPFCYNVSLTPTANPPAYTHPTPMGTGRNRMRESPIRLGAGGGFRGRMTEGASAELLLLDVLLILGQLALADVGQAIVLVVL